MQVVGAIVGPDVIGFEVGDAVAGTCGWLEGEAVIGLAVGDAVAGTPFGRLEGEEVIGELVVGPLSFSSSHGVPSTVSVIMAVSQTSRSSHVLYSQLSCP